jgi:FkbM family methyltransferase
MIQWILNLYEVVFCRTVFYKFNKFLFVASAKGLGLGNSPEINARAESSILSYFIKQNRSDKPVVFDVGANIGSYSAKIKNLIPNAQLVAFEPHPATYKRLVESAEKYGFTPVNKGCGATSGKLKFYDYSDQSEGSEHATLLQGVFENIHHSTSMELEVEVTTIDEYLKENNLKGIDFLKIDTEGYEFEVLKGCRNALENNQIQMIYFEFNSMNMLSRVYFNDFLQLLKGYQFYRSVSDGMIPIDINQSILSEQFVFQNILAIRK